jgi:hypothetical protein
MKADSRPATGCVRSARAHFLEACVEEANHRNIQAVEPDDRFAAAVNAVVAVIVPGPARGNDEVARHHGCAFTVDCRISATAMDDEAQRRLHVAVGRRDLARQNQLQSGIERLRHAGVAGQRGVLEHEHAAHGFLGRDQGAGLFDVGQHLAPFPQRGHTGPVGLVRHQCAKRFPQGNHVEFADLLIESFPV